MDDLFSWNFFFNDAHILKKVFCLYTSPNATFQTDVLKILGVTKAASSTGVGGYRVSKYDGLTATTSTSRKSSLSIGNKHTKEIKKECAS